jgi:predicted amidohydrolase YtcJ
VALQHLMLEIFREEGVRMAAGTDAALPEGLQVVPGWSLHEELAILESTGATPYQALRQATRDAAAFMGREGEGMIKVGARADLVLLEGNPLEDLSHATRPVAVVTEGDWIGRDRLDAQLAGIAAENESREAEAAQLDGYWGQDIPALAAAYREIEDPSEELATFMEQHINRAGYTLVAEENMEAAIAAFEANVETFPESANCYDSLAEAHLTIGERETAIALYRKALEVDPTFTNAADMLKKVGVEP